MNQSDTKTLWISVGAALFAVLMLYSWMQAKNKEVTTKFGKRKTVVVAKQDINEMYPLDETVVEVIEVPEDYVAPQALTDPSELRGYVALTPIIKGEQILRTKISQPGALTGLSYQVSPGKRAITIPIDAMRGVAKLLKPGDRIDMIASVVSGSGQNQKREVKALMQNVIILATGTNIQNQLPADYELDKSGTNYLIKSLTKNTNYDSITIEASPAEAQKLIFIMATNPSDLFMTLRNPSDTGPIGGALTTSVEDVLGRSQMNPAGVVPRAAASMPPSQYSEMNNSESSAGSLSPSSSRSLAPKPRVNQPKKFKSL
jgi:pilus assembly protein CpaB